MNLVETRIIPEAKRFEFLQWVRLWLRQKIRSDRGQLDSFSHLDEGLDIRHSGSISFAPQDLASAGVSPSGRVELRVHFMGLQGASSPLPAYMVDPLLKSDDQWQALAEFYRIFENRTYRLLAQGLILRSPGIRAELGASDHLQAHLRALGGCTDASAESRRLGGFALLVPQGRSRAGLRRFLAQQLDVSLVDIQDDGLAWVPNPAKATLGTAILDGSSALGQEIPVGGDRVDIQIGPLPWAQYALWATQPDKIRAKVKVLVEDYLPRPMVWEAVALLDPSGVPPEYGRSLGDSNSETQARLGAISWLGTENPEAARLLLN